VNTPFFGSQVGEYGSKWFWRKIPQIASIPAPPIKKLLQNKVIARPDDEGLGSF
jgi:hypothetical protein